MSNLHLRRLVSTLTIATLSLSLFMLASGTSQAAQTVTGTPVPGDAGTLPASALPSGSPNPLETPVPGATSEAQNDVWSPPVNVSQSGAASAPVIAAEADGTLHVLWWDKFDGTKYAYFSADKGWSKPVTVAAIVGARPTTQNPTPVAPAQLRFFVDGSHELHAFWIDARGNLLYAQSRAGAINSWSAGVQLASAPLAWNVTLDGAGALHIVYIRPANNPQLPSGIYYRVSNNGGQLWENVHAIVESPYFRTMAAAQAHVDVASNGAGTVIVSWDDPQLKRSFYAQSADAGKTFGDPIKIDAADAVQNDSVEQARFFALSSGQFLRLWQAGDNCLLYQQQSDDKVENWNVPVRVLPDLGGCPQAIDAIAMPNNQLFAEIQLGGNDSAGQLTVWDGQTWLPPQSLRVSFVNPVTNQTTGLGCLNFSLVGAKLALIGCGDSFDIWSTISLKDVTEMLPALTTAWTPPLVVANWPGDADLPAVAAEADGRMHLMWGQTSPDNGPNSSLIYSRGDGASWTSPASVLSSPHGGKAEAPAMLADAGGTMHVVWSGGFGGEVYYSHSFIRDAASPNGWASPALLPAPSQAGSAPALVADANATLHVIYAIPLNEARGVYYTRSTDQGGSWTAPQLIFDAAAAGWAMVSDAHLVVDSANHLHATWMQSALPPATTHLGIYYSRSEDGGTTWSTPTQISAIDTGNAVLAASAPGEIHLLWTANLSGQPQLWHQWSTDDGATWTKATPVLELSNVMPRADLVTDGAGHLYLTGVESTLNDSAALFYLLWNQGQWINRETLALGYVADDGAGAHGLILPTGRLGVFYRVRAPNGTGGSHYILGYAERPVEVSIVPPQPTFTPQPTQPVLPSVTLPATLTAVPTLDLNTPNVNPVSQQDLYRIGAILAGMLVVVVVAMIGLRLSQR